MPREKRESMLTVMKFGGTSVESIEAIERVTKIITNTDGQKAVIVSAISEITNFLVGLCEDVPTKRDEVLKVFERKHLDIARAILDDAQYMSFVDEFKPRIAAFRSLLYDTKAMKDPYYRDNVTSQGERFSSLLLSHKLRAIGVRSAALTAEDCGIRAVGNPLNGEADLVETERGMGVKVKGYIVDGGVPVITGFYGCLADGRPLTFGRGGSDYAAAVVANALNADMLEIWTDVDGFMSADPKVVSAAKKIDEMTYAEASELAYFGAKVLHPRTIEPVREKHIPLKVRNSFKPEEPGTLISQIRTPKNELLRSVAVKTDLSIMTVRSPEVAYRPDVVAQILKKISENNDAIYSISTSLSTLAVLIHNNDVKATLMKLNELNDDIIEKIDVTGDVALICCVGDNLLTTCGVSGYIFGAVKEAQANVVMISEGSSEVSLNFVVPNGHVMNVIKSLHHNFVETRGA